MIRRTVIVQGALAFAARRVAAALGGENGLQIMTVTQSAARLAGGFVHQVTGEDLKFAVARALDAREASRRSRPSGISPGMTPRRRGRRKRHGTQTFVSLMRRTVRRGSAISALLEDRVRAFSPWRRHACRLLSVTRRARHCNLLLRRWVQFLSRVFILSSLFGVR